LTAKLLEVKRFYLAGRGNKKGRGGIRFKGGAVPASGREV
jgi:hypothetical protein